MAKIADLLSVERGEGRVLTLLILHSFCTGFGRILLITAASAIYLGAEDLSTLPYVYFGMGIVGAAIGLVFGRAQKTLSFERLFSFTLLGLAVSIGLFWTLLVAEVGWVAIWLVIWTDVVDILTALELRAVAGRLFNVRQTKRLYALIGCGDVTAGLVGGLSVSLIVSAMGTPVLLLVAAGALLAAFGVLQVILRTAALQPEETEDATEVDSRSSRQPWWRSLRDRYVLLILGIAAANVLTLFLLQAAFFAESKAQFPDADDLAGFFGVAFGLAAVATLAFQAAIAARFLGRFGAAGGLIILPAALLVGVLIAFAAGRLALPPAVVFWAVVLTRLAQAVLYDSITSGAELLLYQPLPPRKRLWVQSVLEAIAMPLVAALSGAVLLVFLQLASLDGTSLSPLLIVLLVAWLLGAVTTGRWYRQALEDALGKRLLPEISVVAEDSTTIALLESRLADPRPTVVIYCLDRLEASGYAGLGAALVGVLAHPYAGVRHAALQRIEQARPPGARDAVHRLSLADPSPRVRAAAVRALMALAETEALELVTPRLEDPEPEVSRSAAVGLMRYGGIEGVLAAGVSLLRMLDSPNGRDRAAAAATLGDVGIRGFFQPLRKLLHDEDPVVVTAALGATSKIAHPALWPDVIDLLEVPAVRHSAYRALLSGGKEVLATVAGALEEDRRPSEARRRLLRVVSRVGGPEAIGLLRRRMADPHRILRHEALLGLANCGYQAEPDELPAIQEMVRTEMGHAEWLLAAAVDLEESPELTMLSRALDFELRRSRSNILLLLSFVYSSQAVLRVKAIVEGASTDEQYAYALELLDSLVAPALKPRLFPLLEPLQPREALRRATDGASAQHVTVDERLHLLLLQPPAWISDWTSACAIDAAMRRGAAQFADEIRALETSPQAWVRDTAKAALSTAFGGPGERR